jgi:hypothetical protein
VPVIEAQFHLVGTGDPREGVDDVDLPGGIVDAGSQVQRRSIGKENDRLDLIGRAARRIRRRGRRRDSAIGVGQIKRDFPR